MPIFLDRHDEMATPEEIAALHVRDLQVQDKYGVKFLTYWHDARRGATFCLIDAPHRAAADGVHGEAHGHVANKMIEVDLSAVEAFLGRIEDPPSGASKPIDETAFRAVMFTDLVGSTEMTARLGDARGVELVRAHDALVRRGLARHEGREVKHTGDGIMASFASSQAAIDCAAAIQRSFADYNAKSDEPIHVRIAVHAGEPVEDSHDLFGSAVQLAARIRDSAAADEIMVSEVVRGACDETAGFKDLGRKLLKGFAQPVQVYALQWR
jgi:class 3 adenylate cyclase